MIILDTNVVSEASKPVPDAKVAEWIDRQNWPDLFICGPVVMEQAFGAQRVFLKTGSSRYRQLLDEMIEIQFRGRIMQFDGMAPRIAGEIRAQRERNGRPMSIPDAMIAAICVVHGATLATRNIRDFHGIDLNLVNPFEAGA